MPKVLNPLQRRLRSDGITITECQNVLGVSYATMAMKIEGKNDFTVSQMWKLSDYIGLTMQEMLDCFPPLTMRKKVGKRGRKPRKQSA